MTRQLAIGLVVAAMAAGLSFAFGCTGLGGSSAFRVMRTELIYSVRYDATSEALTVVQRNGDVFEYAKVPAEVYGDLLKAPDKDAFFRESVADKFKSSKLDFSKPPAN